MKIKPLWLNCIVKIKKKIIKDNVVILSWIPKVVGDVQAKKQKTDDENEKP